MKVKEIVTRVRAAIDELTQNSGELSFLTSDEENLEAIIIDKIPYALTYVMENAPEEKLDNSQITHIEPVTGSIPASGSCVTVLLPGNVLRVLSARLSSWSLSPIPVSEHSQEYLMQQDAYARGSWDRPVCAIVYRGASRYIELYSARSTTDTVSISCLLFPTIPSTAIMVADQDTDISVSSRLAAAFIYYIAGLTLTAFREDIAPSLIKIAEGHLFRKEPS